MNNIAGNYTVPVNTQTTQQVSTHDLDILMTTDVYIINQKQGTNQMIKAVTGLSTENRFYVWSPNGELLLNIKEQSDIINRLYAKKQRSWTMNAYNGQNNNLVMQMSRKSKLCSCNEEITIYDTINKCQIGMINETKGFCTCNPRFNANVNNITCDANQNYQITSNTCALCCNCCNDIEFYIQQYGDTVGKLTKKWQASEMFIDASNFVVTVPKIFTLEQRATVLGGAMAIKYGYFETDGGKLKPKIQNYNNHNTGVGFGAVNLRIGV